MKFRLLVVAAAILAAPLSNVVSAGPQCMKQTVDAQGSGPNKRTALTAAIQAWEKRVSSVDPTYADSRRAQNWTVNYPKSSSGVVANVAGIPCQ